MDDQCRRASRRAAGDPSSRRVGGEVAGRIQTKSRPEFASGRMRAPAPQCAVSATAIALAAPVRVRTERAGRSAAVSCPA
jgi:hypothetical protein